MRCIEILLISFLVMLLLSIPGEVAAAGNTLSVGSAEVNITPTEPVPMSGYSSRKDPSKGGHDEIFTRALVFQDGQNNRAALISVENIGIPEAFWEEVTARIEKESHIPRDNILLSAVHDHSAPTPARIYSNNVSQATIAYTNTLKENVIAVVKQAAANLQPVAYGVGKGVCKMSMNRRALNANGGLKIGKNPYGPCDQEVGVVRFDNLQGQPMAIFVNWPCHATIMGAGNYLISGDWPGATSRFVAKEMGNQVIVPVTAGASANIDPIYRVLPDFHGGETEAVGIILGTEVMKVAQGIQTYPYGTITSSQRVITLPGKARGESYAAQESYEPGPDVNVRLSALRVRDVVFAGVSGELFTQIGMQIKALSPYKNTFIITHCNGSSGYLVSDDAYAKGGYEVMATRVMSGAEKEITQSLIEMIHGL